MKITKIKVYQVDLVVKGKPFSWNDGEKVVPVFDSTVVEIFTDSGIVGIGEVCPMPYLLASYAKGVRSAIREFGAALIGQNPLEIDKMHTIMDGILQGHCYAKTPIDIALWDILGKHANLPISTLLGGNYGDSVTLYMTISNDTAEVMAANVRKYHAEGYRRYQLKVGGNPEIDLPKLEACRKEIHDGAIVVADANAGWSSHQAMRVANRLRDLDFFLEQPCLTWDEMMTLRKRCHLPIVLDESINNIHDVIKAYADHMGDVIGLKLSKVGGLSNMRRCRDLCVKLGMPMKIEDTWGSAITQAAITHMAISTPPKYRLLVPMLHVFSEAEVATGIPPTHRDQLPAISKPGLGVALNYDALGEPEFIIDGNGQVTNEKASKVLVGLELDNKKPTSGLDLSNDVIERLAQHLYQKGTM